MSYANNKGADQPAHSRRLISAFVVRCLVSISRYYSQNFKTLASFCGCTGCLRLALSEIPENMFCHVVAQVDADMYKSFEAVLCLDEDIAI